MFSCYHQYDLRALFLEENNSCIASDSLRFLKFQVHCPTIRSRKREIHDYQHLITNYSNREKEKTKKINRWRKLWASNSISKFDMMLTPIILCLIVGIYSNFLYWHENRSDVSEFSRLSDPLLPYFEPVNFSLPLFFMVYGAIIIGVIFAADKPYLLMEIAQTKIMVIIVRMVCLYLTPLEAPKDTIVLADPFVHGNNPPYVRDLFFSGHTATTAVVFFTCRTQFLKWKIFFFINAILTGFLVTLQKTHYTIDVFAAPFFVYSCHRIVCNFRKILKIDYAEKSIP